MRWAICMKNLEAGKWQLITPDMTVDEDDPLFGDDVHIVPVVQHPDKPDHLSFGVHDFVRECPCHTKVEEQVSGRTIVTHSGAVN